MLTSFLLNSSPVFHYFPLFHQKRARNIQDLALLIFSFVCVNLADLVLDFVLVIDWENHGKHWRTAAPLCRKRRNV